MKKKKKTMITRKEKQKTKMMVMREKEKTVHKKVNKKRG
jgi:hypothetical protein